MQRMLLIRSDQKFSEPIIKSGGLKVQRLRDACNENLMIFSASDLARWNPIKLLPRASFLRMRDFFLNAVDILRSAVR